MSNRIHNLTTALALPLLGWRRAVYQPYLIDAYIRHEGVDHFTENHIFVLLKWSDDERFKKLEDVLTKHSTHVSMYEPDDRGEYVMHVFRVSESVEKDYHRYLKGEYSKMSEKAKDLILQSAKPDGVTAKILRKDPKLKIHQEDKLGVYLDPDSEVWTCIHDEHVIRNEIFCEETLFNIE